MLLSNRMGGRRLVDTVPVGILLEVPIYLFQHHPLLLANTLYLLLHPLLPQLHNLVTVSEKQNFK
jgi:hypothetical protein